MDEVFKELQRSRDVAGELEIHGGLVDEAPMEWDGTEHGRLASCLGAFRSMW